MRRVCVRVRVRAVLARARSATAPGAPPRAPPRPLSRGANVDGDALVVPSTAIREGARPIVREPHVCTP